MLKNICRFGNGDGMKKSESKSSEILKIWESHHGKLDDKWKSEFFHHPAMERLKSFEFTEINEILQKEHFSSLTF